MALLTKLIKPPDTIANGVYLATVIRVFEGIRLIKTQIPAYQMPIIGVTMETSCGPATYKFDLLGTNNANGEIEEDDVKTAELWRKLGKFGYCCGMPETFIPSQLLNKQCSITIKNNKIIKITPP